MEKGINSSPQKRIEPFLAEEALIADPDLSLDSNHAREAQERTPKEWREKLRGLIRGAKDPFGVSERGERSKEYLAGRSGELDAEAKEYGPKAAEFIASLPEKYNKLNWKTKLAVTGVLMLGVSLTATAIPLLSGALSAALYSQRALGGIGLGINKRKALDARIAANSDYWLAGKSELAKNAYATALAAVYMGGTAFAVHEGVEALNALGVNEWFGTTPKGVADAPPEVPKPAAAAVAVENAAPALVATEMPSVEASAGHGYEYMVKRLWEELQTKHLDPSRYAPDSDVHRLLTTDADSIDKVVHQIAADPSHGFFNADGTSVLINLDSHMTVNADGNIQLDDITKAPDDAPTTPAYHPETPEVTDESEVATLPVEESVVAPDDSVLRDNEGNVVYDGEGNPVHTGTYETPPGTNEFGLTIPADEPHLYADTGAKHVFVYGGSPAERANAILEYLIKNPQSVVFSADDSETYRIPWYLVEGKMTPGTPMRTSGFFGFFSSFMKAPGPEEFAKIIK